jgi:hypothetical protein
VNDKAGNEIEGESEDASLKRMFSKLPLQRMRSDSQALKTNT